MDIKITLKPYLEQLKLTDNADNVPSLRELARAVGMHESPFYRFANNRIGKIDRQLLAAIIHHLREAGFKETDIHHLLRYIE